MTSVVEVSEYERDRSFALRVVEGIPIHAEMSFTPSAGGTDFAFRAHGSLSGPMRLAQPLLRRSLRRQFARHCATLKQLLENEQARDPSGVTSRSSANRRRLQGRWPKIDIRRFITPKSPAKSSRPSSTARPGSSSPAAIRIRSATESRAVRAGRSAAPRRAVVLPLRVSIVHTVGEPSLRDRSHWSSPKAARAPAHARQARRTGSEARPECRTCARDDGPAECGRTT